MPVRQLAGQLPRPGSEHDSRGRHVVFWRKTSQTFGQPKMVEIGFHNDRAVPVPIPGKAQGRVQALGDIPYRSIDHSLSRRRGGSIGIVQTGFVDMKHAGIGSRVIDGA
ncbi:MAG: hypothetical protein CVU36_07355 [Betaproteobacteria bacterium HGW-Betaproteobacteria-9]|nr:MAG: hypothetical protein CVU36_07355 [Betaproteobacteria bacterium HGW-Betaproteobacteria-9]